MVRPVELYVNTRERFLALVAEVPPTLRILATPEWDVRMLVAHLVGLNQDLVVGNVDDDAGSTWTAAQVDARDVEVDPDAWALIGPRRKFLLDLQVQEAGLPALEVSTPEGDQWTVGSGTPVGRVTAPRWDLWRSLEGRRSRAQVRSFDWSVDPEPYLPVWPASAFDWPA